MQAARTRVRIKGTKLYVPAYSSTAYETTGSGRRSLAMRAASYGPNAAIASAGPQLRDQSREAERKNPYAGAIADRWAANLVGTGIVPQPEAKEARALWTSWTDESSADGTLDFYGQQGQVVRSLVTAGECFVRQRARRESDGLSVPLQIQVLEADYVPLDLNRMDGNNEIRQGIEFDAIGRRVAYWMYRQHPGDMTLSMNVDMTPYRVPASEVLHVYDAMRRPGQNRGEPWLARILGELKDLDAYVDAELVRKKVAALIVGFLQRNVPEGMSEDDLVKAWGEASKLLTDGVGSATVEPGTVMVGEPGEKLEWSTPTDVGGMYEVFLKHHERRIAASAGILYEQLTGDFSDVNDRTWRAAMNEFKRRCEMLQHHLMVFQFCRPIWRRWAALARMSGKLTAEQAPDTVKWIPQAWAYINPVQDLEAAKEEIRIGLASRSQKASERGLDAREIDEEQAADNASADENGVKYDSDGRNAAKSKAPTPQPADPAEDPPQKQPRKAA